MAATSSDTALPTRITLRPIESLLPYARNAKLHPSEQIAALAASITEFGFTSPVLVHEGQIIAGHGRVLAAQRLGLIEVPCIDLEHLTPTQARAYRLADNRLNESPWDTDLLALELQDLLDLGAAGPELGFNPEELDALLIEPPEFTPATEDEQGRLDTLDPIMVACPHCGREFDLRATR